MSRTSEHLITSAVFCCNSCGAPVALEQINSDDLAYVCQNRSCGRSVHVDCPEGLRVVEGESVIAKVQRETFDATLTLIERKLVERRASVLQLAA
jgi:hypothetical protein